MLVPVFRITLTVVLGLISASTAHASASPVGHFSYVDGAVTRLHRFAPTVAKAGVILVEGDQVHVGMGRAEITLVDGSLVQLDEHTRVAIPAVDRVQVIDGRVFVQSNGPGAVIAEAGGKRLHVAPGSAAEVTASTSNDLLVRVVEGDARIESSWGSDVVAATQSAFVSGPTGQPFVSPWVASSQDSFHQWADGRLAILAPPATFLPYAHPTYRQQEYVRLLRSQQHDRRHKGDVTHHNRPADAQRRGDNRRGDQRADDQRGRDQRGRDQARGAERGDRKRDNNTARRTDRRPAAKPPANTTRGGGAGAVVRPR